MLTKAAIIISAILVFAGVATAGTLTSGSSDDTPTIEGTTLPTTTTADVRREDRRADRREDRRADRRANEPGEDLRGPCDEAEHANDPRCAVPGADDRGHDGVDDNDNDRHH